MRAFAVVAVEELIKAGLLLEQVLRGGLVRRRCIASALDRIRCCGYFCGARIFATIVEVALGGALLPQLVRT
jgi:hypothetical protein